MKKICMVVQDKMVKGGIAAVVSGYYGSCLEMDYDITYVESYRDGGKLSKLTKAFSGYVRFARVLITDRPDLVHIHSSFGPSFYRKLPFIYMASLAGVPIVNHIHGADFETFYVQAGERKRRQIVKAYGRCARLIALSGAWKENLSQIVPSDRITVIRNYGILHEEAWEERRERTARSMSAASHPHTSENKNAGSPGSWQNTKADAGLSVDENPVTPSNGPSILFLGELGRRKGCYDIPAVAEKVVKSVPGARFILCGAGSSEDETAIRGLFSEKGISDRVEFPGWVRGDDKDRRLREADVFYLPSYQEGLPMSILDAMGYGLPIVSTDTGGIPELVRDGVNGSLCNPGDTAAMAEALIGLLKDDDLRLNWGRESLHIVRTEFSLDNHLQKLETVWEDVLQQTPDFPENEFSASR